MDRLVEAVMNIYDNRYNEICHLQAGQTMGTKSLSSISSLEKARVGELTTQLG